jgi:hypothetical protein
MLYPDYIYIDTAFDGVRNRNNLIKSSELNSYARRWKAEHKKDFTDCYTTYFRYPEDMMEHFKGNNTVSGYGGSLYSDFLPIDVDSEDLTNSIQLTKTILLHLQTKFDVDIKAVPIYFSGAKGFHVEIPSGLFGFNPSPQLHEIFKRILKRFLPEGVVIDDSIYDKVRLWRIKNTLNSKSGLYKIPLPSDELLNLTIPEIKELARTPRIGVFFDDNVTLNPNLRQLYLQVEGRSLGVKEHKKYMKVLNGGANKGERNTTLTSYAGRVKSKGIAISEAQVILHSINRTLCNPPLSDAEVREILESVYSYPSEDGFQLNTIPWGELVGGEEPELDFLIEDILPSGNLIILAGKPKLGKSLLALQMALSVSLDTSLWNKKVKNGGVLLISTEDGHIRLKKRIWRMVGDPDKHNPDCHFYVNNCILTDTRVMDALRMKVEELKPRLVILDPLINLFQGKELNSGEHMNEILRPLQELGRESGACILVVHHTRKTGGENPVDIVQGSITISGVADGILILKTLQGADRQRRATLDVILKDAEAPNRIVLRLNETLRWEIEGEYDEVITRSLRDQVIETLRNERDGLTISNLMNILGVEYTPLYRLLARLEDEKDVMSDKTGRFHTKLYFLQNYCKTKMQNEKSLLTDYKHSENADNGISFCKTLKSAKRNEKLQNENGGESDNEDIDPWDIEKT